MIRQFFQRFALIFVLLFMLSLPFEQAWLPNVGSWLAPVFHPLLEGLGRWLGLSADLTYALESDSTGLYLQLGLLVFVGATGAFAWLQSRPGSLKPCWGYVLELLCSYYLVILLLHYGSNKVFKVQFFLPEPNTLHTPLGELSKDILFWSTMGSSYAYTVFGGLLEVIAGLLLLFRNTRLTGALLSFGILLNVWIINLSFDISVKVLSGFLLLLALLIIVPHLPGLYQFFIQQKNIQLTHWYPNWKKKNYLIIKGVLTLFIIGNALYPYFITGNFNDDLAQRPYLHGSYEVEEFILNHKCQAFNIHNNNIWRRIHIHRKGYFIIENMQGKMMDYKIDSYANQKLQLSKQGIIYQLQFKHQDSNLYLYGQWEQVPIAIDAKKIDLQQLPLLQKQFHWTVDQAK